MTLLISAQAFPPRLGGIQTLMDSVARALSDHGSVHVFADGDRAAARYDQQSHAPYAVTRFGGLKPLRRRAKAKAIAAAVRGGGVQVVICDSWKSAEHLPALPVPVLVYAHGNEFPKDDHAKQARIARALSKANAILSVSTATKDRLAAFLSPEIAARIRVMANPVEPLLDADPEDVAYAESLWPSDGLRALSLCRLVDWKGVDRAIEATAALRSEGRAVQLVIAGDGPDQERLTRLAETSGASDHIHFAGRVDGARKSALLRSAELYLQPGRQVGDQVEGFGISYVEAALAGLPSLSGKAGGAGDAVIHEQTGLCVDGTDLDAVTDALRRLLDAPGRRSHMGEQGQARAQDLLSPAYAARLMQVIESLARSTDAAPSGGADEGTKGYS